MQACLNLKFFKQINLEIKKKRIFVNYLLGKTLTTSMPFLSSKPKPFSDFLIVTKTSSKSKLAVLDGELMFELLFIRPSFLSLFV